MRLVIALLLLVVAGALVTGSVSTSAVSVDRDDVAPDGETPEDCVSSTDLLDSSSDVDASEYADCLIQQYEYELRMDLVAAIDWVEVQWSTLESEFRDQLVNTIDS